jgi:hypothetical protein
LSQSGEWRLRRSGREVAIRLTEQEQIYEIGFIGKDTLLLEPVEGQGLPFPRVLVKVP